MGGPSGTESLEDSSPVLVGEWVGLAGATRRGCSGSGLRLKPG